jgi:hypothetical protein
MSALIEIGGVELAPVEYRGVRVMTLGMMDSVHKRPDGTARRNFNENKARLIEGEDFHEVTQPDEIRMLGFSRPQGGTPASMVLLTETGYSMVVKSFTDDLAWEVQRQLVRSYFAEPRKTIEKAANLDGAFQALKLAPLAIKAAQAFGLSKNAAAISANQAVTKLTGTNLLGLLGQTHLEQEEQVQYFTPTELGARVALSGQKVNALLAQAGFQAKVEKTWELLQPGRQYAMIYDTGKKHSDGVPVQQVKWSASVLDALPPATA